MKEWSNANRQVDNEIIDKWDKILKKLEKKLIKKLKILEAKILLGPLLSQLCRLMRVEMIINY